MTNHTNGHYMGMHRSMRPGRNRAAHHTPIKDHKVTTSQLDIIFSPLCPSVAAWCIRFSQEPADQSVVLGERVVLSCVVFNYSGIVQWTKDGLALGIGEGLRGEQWGIETPQWERVKKEREKKTSCRDQSGVEKGNNSATVLVQFWLYKTLTKAIMPAKV